MIPTIPAGLPHGSWRMRLLQRNPAGAVHAVAARRSPRAEIPGFLVEKVGSKFPSIRIYHTARPWNSKPVGLGVLEPFFADRLILRLFHPVYLKFIFLAGQILIDKVCLRQYITAP